METIKLSRETKEDILHDIKIGEYDEGYTSKGYTDKKNGVEVIITTKVEYLRLQNFEYDITDEDGKEYAMDEGQLDCLQQALYDGLKASEREIDQEGEFREWLWHNCA